MWVAYLVLLLIGLFLLVKGSDIFVDTSSSIARIFNLSEMMIGMTLVCFGTGLPELCLSVMSGIKGSSDLVVGNIIGTNMFNMCAILGIVCLINPIKLLKDTVRKDINMSLVTALAFLILSIDTLLTDVTHNVISRTDGLILLLFFGIYIYYMFYQFDGITLRHRKKKEKKQGIKRDDERKPLDKKTKKLVLKKLCICAFSGALIYFGSECVIQGATNLAKLIGISEIFISIMVIAIGTSLPEVATSVVAIKKGSINIAIGNLIGSNMMNMLLVIGVTSLINPIAIATTSLWVDAIVFVIVCALITFNARIRFINKGEYEISRTEGIILIAVYVTYVMYVVFRG